MRCQKCGEETFLPFRCPYCGGHFCSEHRLPENHACPKLELAHTSREERLLIPQKQSSYEYTIVYIPVEPKRRFYFSSKEITHLTIAALLVFSIGLSLGISWRTTERIGGISMLFTFASLVTASLLIHELAHKFTAQKEGLWAEFRLMLMGLILTAVSIVSPFFKIISPGAVVISGFTSKKGIGKVSIAGPLTNIILSATLVALWFMIWHPILIYGAAFNAWIALFNLVPFGVLDGFKVFIWKKTVWASAFTLSLALTALTYMYM